jgi:hypothetical protein
MVKHILRVVLDFSGRWGGGGGGGGGGWGGGGGGGGGGVLDTTRWDV